ncbi:MAG: hypothetical protein QOD29_3114 [Alphaproteobacteria bacterium]|nr:hypothetical protein [Alphaproteobacteria bacterium]
MHRRSILLGVVLSLSISHGSVALAQPATTNPSFPASGHQYEVKFPDRQFSVDYKPDGKEMTFTRPDGSGDTVQYTAIEIRPNVFMVYWTGPKDATHVTQVVDFEREIIYATAAYKDGRFVNLRGTIKRLQ